ncbi:MAG: hypothetical protein OIF50_06525 [Flavobacteriaceae bacterium]|nr:hypothetical protein [Flavobacteriaceae bacterium]
MAKSQSIINKILRASEVYKHIATLTDYAPSNSAGSIKHFEKFIKTARTANKMVEDLRDERTEKGSKRQYNYYKSEDSLLVRVDKILAYLNTMKSNRSLSAVKESVKTIKETLRGKRQRKDSSKGELTASLAIDNNNGKKPRKAKGALFYYYWLELGECLKHLKSLGPSYKPSVDEVSIAGITTFLNNLEEDNKYIDDLDSQINDQIYKRNLAMDQIATAISIADDFLLFKYGKNSEVYKRFKELK